jgi:hypothetical protein
MASERISVETRRVGDTHEQTIRRIEADGSETVQTATYPELEAILDPDAFHHVFGSDRGHVMDLPQLGRKDHPTPRRRKHGTR